MRSESSSLRSRSLACVLAAGLIGAAVAGCSREASRGNEDPFSNPFRSSSAAGDMTNSTQPRSATAVEAQPLASPTYPRQGEPSGYTSAPRTVPATPAPNYSQGPGPYAPATTGTVNAPRPGDPGWRWDGGTAVTVQQGETVDIIARRFGVPAAAVLRANNIADGNRIQPGQRLVIPSYQAGQTNAASTQANTSQPPRPVPATAPAQRTHSVHVVNTGETLSSIAKRYNVKSIDVARANKIDAKGRLRVGQRLTIANAIVPKQSIARGGAASAAGKRVETPASAPTTQHAAGPPANETVASVKPVDEPAPAPSLGGSPQFRWPIKGRVISGFGQKPNGQHNDGINLSVPEGAEVKAAESGAVAYAGNELKGYGNLVLVRHSDGWVTAYAHNSQILVKRGDAVRRGQVIARAGQTGGVASPQLHFEIRKGSTPVDPAQYLSSL